MADINLVRPHLLSIPVAKARVQKTADELDAEYGLRSEWQGRTLRFDRTGLHGEIHVTDSEIQLQVHLSLLLKPLRASLVARIEDKFERLFPEAKGEARGRKSHKKTTPAAG